MILKCEIGGNVEVEHGQIRRVWEKGNRMSYLRSGGRGQRHDYFEDWAVYDWRKIVV